MGEQTVIKAGPNKRVCAILIDFFLVIILSLLLEWLFKINSKSAIFTLIYFVFFVFRDAYNGQGPGKMIVGLRVVDSNSNAASLISSFKRNINLFWGYLAYLVVSLSKLPERKNSVIMFIVLVVVVLIFLIEYFLIAYGKEKRRLGDKLAGTQVIDLRPNQSDRRYLILSIAILIVSLFVIFGISRKAINTGSATDFIDRGTYYIKDQKFDLAISQFKKAIEIDPKNAEAYYGLALAYHNKNDDDQTVINYTKSIELRPDYADAYMRRAVIYGEKSNFDKAISDVDKAIALKPDDSFVYMIKVSICEKRGDLDGALTAINRAIEISPTDTDIILIRAKIYFRMNDYDKVWEDVHRIEAQGGKLDPKLLDELKSVSGRDN